MLHFVLIFFNDPATTEIYTLSLHDALPICWGVCSRRLPLDDARVFQGAVVPRQWFGHSRDGRRAGYAAHGRPQEEIGRAQSELQSLAYLVCRLLLEKKN